MDIYQILITHNRAWSKKEVIIFCIIIVGVFLVLWGLIWYRKIKKIQAIATIALVVFMWIVLASTVFTREQTIRRYKLIPFWSWEKIIFEKDMSLLQENFLNCILLMPIGCLLPMVMAHAVKLKNVFAVGVIFSAVIEFSQLICKRGMFEWDDIIHNGLGCVIGCFLTNEIIKLYKKRKSIR